MEYNKRAARWQRRCIDIKHAARRQRIGTTKMHFMVIDGSADAGQHIGIADEVSKLTAGVDLRSRNAVEDRVRPADHALGRDGNDSLLHGVEHGGQLFAPALNLRKAL